jgi:hypothetical protein
MKCRVVEHEFRDSKSAYVRLHNNAATRSDPRGNHKTRNQVGNMIVSSPNVSLPPKAVTVAIMDAV